MLRPGALLKLTTPTIAVVLDENNHEVAEIVPEGAIVEVLDPLTPANNLLFVRWNRRTCRMFSIDLRERGVVIDELTEEAS
jgi:hypothetical protein